MIYFSLDSINRIVKTKKPSRIILVTSLKLKRRLGWAIEELKRQTAKIPFKTTIVPDGERAKAWPVLKRLIESFTKNNLDRQGLVLALGGGSVGDLVSFACSIYLRGIAYVQIPTTLLAQVDSAIGGKTAINFSSYKNQVGSFYKPVTICIDQRFIKSLTNDQLIDGLAEIVKMGIIKEPAILRIIEKQGFKIRQNPRELLELIRLTIKAKQFFVSRDPYDQGVRQILNFGHTVGHALELKYRLHHGSAVLIGMLKELTIGEKLNKTPRAVRARLIKVLGLLNLVFDTNSFRVDAQPIFHDKKVRSNKIMFPIVRRFGDTELKEIPLKRFLKLIK